jgi:alanine-synthesizing transaminase
LMNVPPVEFLGWHKARPRTRFSLASSGVPRASVAGLLGDGGAFDAELARCGGYGHPALIAAIARRYGVSEERVLPVPGASMANFVALACVTERGQRVLLETPVYEPLRRAAELLGLEVVPLPRVLDDRGFPGPPDLSVMKQALGDGAAAAMLTNHHNPGGQRLTPEEAGSVAGLCAAHGVALVLDEVYLDFAHVNLGEPLWTAAAHNDCVVATNSLTKVYGLGPLRVGWMVATPEIVQRARRLIDHLHVEDSAASQVLGVRAFERIEEFEDRARSHCRAARSVLNDWLASRRDVTSNRDDGAAFALLAAEGIDDGDRLAEALLRWFDTLVVPGRFFGCPRFVRIGFGASAVELREALDRIGQALDRLRGQPR